MSWYHMSYTKLAMAIIGYTKISSPIEPLQNRTVRYTNSLKDYRKSIDFYNKLKLLKGTSWDDPGDKGAMFHLSDRDLLEIIYKAKKGSPYTNPFAMSKQVKDVEAAHRYLKELGVNPADITDREWGHTDTYIIDPLGNRINFWADTK